MAADRGSRPTDPAAIGKDVGVRRRVVVTGVGAHCAGGSNAAALWDAARSGRPATGQIEVEGLGSLAAGRAVDPDAEGRFGRKEARRMDRVARFATLAAAEALEDAGDLGLPAERVGAAFGCCHGGVATLEAAFRAVDERGADRISPLSIPLLLTNSPVAAVSRVHGLRGPSLSPATACAAGSDAVGQAAILIASGRADAVVAGGAEAPLAPMIIAGYRKLGALSPSDGPTTSRPFDTSRDGFVIGEGSAALVLEEREHARSRGAEIIAELAGYGNSSDAAHITDPDADGAGPARAMAASLADAGVAPDDVGWVNAHATSTVVGDLAEAHALERAGLAGAPVSAPKSVLGHPLGAAGAIEAVLSALALRDGVVPPTANLNDPEPEPALDHVTAARTGDLRVVLSNSFGFGGHNACLTLTAA